MANDNLGDLNVNITGDASDLQTSLDAAAGSAQAAGDQIQAAFQAASDASGLAGRDLEIFQQLLEQDVAAGVDLNQSLEDLSNSASTLGDQIASGASAALESLQSNEANANQETQGLNEALAQTGPAAEEAASGLMGMVSTLGQLVGLMIVSDYIKEFGEACIDAYGATQQIETSLQLLGSTADQASATVENLAEMSINLAVPFESLESSARTLSVTFQGIAGIDVADVLTAAANAAALTGRSFDTVAAALQRVEVTGAVTSRQLVALGLTWQQLATQAGTSVEDVQAALKKGGQDATTDLQLVVATINSIAAGAAQAQAQTILGQITVLENEVTLLFDAIGSAVAPVMEGIVGAIGLAIDAVRGFLNVFQELPVPVQNLAVVIGLATAAVIPLGAAFSVVGFALKGVASAAEGVVTIWGMMTGAALSDAGAETVAASATAAHGAAASVAATEIGALSVAEGAAAGEAGALSGSASAATAALGTGGLAGTLGLIATLALPVGMAIAVTADNVKQLASEWTEMDQTIATKSILDAINKDETVSGLQDIGFSVGQIKGAFLNVGTGALTVFQQISQGAGTPIQQLTDLGYSTKQVQTALKGVGTTAVTAWQAFNSGASIEQMQQVGLNVDEIAKKLNAMGAAANEAFSTAGLGITIAGSSLGTLGSEAKVVVQNVAQLNSNVASAEATLKNLKAASDGSTASLQAIEFESTKLSAAQKALATALGETAKQTKPAADSMQALADANNKAQTTFDDANTTWANLMTAFDNGETTINGLTINTGTLSKAENDLATAYYNATGAVMAWQNTAGNVAVGVQADVNKFQALENAVDQTNAVFQKLQSDYQASVAAGTQTAAQLAQLEIAYNAAQAAANAMAKATDTGSASLQTVTGAVSNLQTIMVNGQQVTVASTSGFVDFSKAADGSKDTLTNFAGVVSDGSQKTVAMTGAVNDNAKGLTNEGTAAGNAVAPIAANTKAKGDNAAAAKAAQAAADALAQHQDDLNKAWAAGDIVVQSYSDDVAHIVGTANDAANAQDNLNQKLKDDAVAAGQAGTGLQTLDQWLGIVATDADKTGNAVDSLTGKLKGLKGAGGGGGGGGGSIGSFGGGGSDMQGGEILGAASLQAMQTGDIQGLNMPGSMAVANPNESLAGFSTSNLMQQIANETGQAVQSIYGTFIPATQAAANMLQALQAQANASGKTLLDTFGGVDTVVTPQLTALEQVSQANTAATTANTTATAANSAQVTSSTQVVVNAQTGLVTAINSQISAVTGVTNTLETAQAAYNAATNQYTADLQTAGIATNTLAADLANVNTAAANLAAEQALAAEAQQALTAAEAQYEADVASGSASAKTLAADLTNVGNAATALAEATGDSTTATLDNTAATAAATSARVASTSENTTATADNTAATAANTTATAANTAATQATTTTQAQAQGGLETLTQAVSGAAQTYVAATYANGVMVTAIQDATTGLWNFATSLNGVVTAITSSAGQMVQSLSAANTQLVQQTAAQINTILSNEAKAGNAGNALSLTGIFEGTGPVPGGPAAGAGQSGFGYGQYNPASFGYESTLPGENQYPTSGAGVVNLTVNVTGNSVTSQALVNQLANAVGSQIITNLRTVAGLKLG